MRRVGFTAPSLSLPSFDRLARNVAFLSAVMNAGVEFEAVDFPQANHLTIHVLAALAKHESKLTSERTKAALAAAKRRGVKLGGFRAGAKLTATARQAGVKANQERAEARAADLAPIIRELQATSITSLRGIADELNRRGIRTPRGKQWLAGSVSQLLTRIGRSGGALDGGRAARGPGLVRGIRVAMSKMWRI